MSDALDALKLMRATGMRPNPSAMPQRPVAFGKAQAVASPAIQKDLFQKEGPAKGSGMLPKTIRTPQTANLLEKPALSGGRGGLFQALKTQAQKFKDSPPVFGNTQKVNAATRPNPFKVMDSTTLVKNGETSGAQSSALKTQALTGTKQDMKSRPSGGVAPVALSFAGVGMLVAPVMGPAALVAKPGLINGMVSKLSKLFLPQ